jgi:hypothetical protein
VAWRRNAGEQDRVVALAWLVIVGMVAYMFFVVGMMATDDPYPLTQPSALDRPLWSRYALALLVPSAFLGLLQLACARRCAVPVLIVGVTSLLGWTVFDPFGR